MSRWHLFVFGPLGLLSSLCVSPLAFGQSQPSAQAESSGAEPVQIVDIEIDGLERTKRHVIERELLFTAGQQATPEQLEESRKRVLNTGLFRTANFRLEPATSDSGAAPGYVYELEVDERWTLLPIASFSRSGGVTNILLGAFETNLLGRYLEVGARYNRFGPTNSFVGWFYDHQFLGEHLFAGMELWWTNRQRLYYDPEGTLVDGYLRQRRKVRLGVEQEWSSWLSTGLNAYLIDDRFTSELLPDELVAGADQRPLPAANLAIPLEATVTLGRINRSSYFRQGLAYTQTLAHSDDLWGASHDWTRWTHELLGFVELPWRQNLGARIGAGASSAAQPEHQFFIGGFDRVRGFVDSRFRGKTYWYANLEYRISSIDTLWFALQHTVFTDVAAASDSLDGLAPVGASSGMGLRLISPKIHRFIIRIDYGLSWLSHGNAPLSFGVGQFF